MTRTRIAGVALVLLGAGMLTRIIHHAGMKPKNPDRAPVEIRTGQTATVTEMVDLRNGNIHLQIPIPPTTKKH